MIQTEEVNPATANAEISRKGIYPIKNIDVVAVERPRPVAIEPGTFSPILTDFFREEMKIIGQNVCGHFKKRGDLPPTLKERTENYLSDFKVIIDKTEIYTKKHSCKQRFANVSVPVMEISGFTLDKGHESISVPKLISIPTLDDFKNPHILPSQIAASIAGREKILLADLHTGFAFYRALKRFALTLELEDAGRYLHKFAEVVVIAGTRGKHRISKSHCLFGIDLRSREPEIKLISIRQRVRNGLLLVI